MASASADQKFEPVYVWMGAFMTASEPSTAPAAELAAVREAMRACRKGGRAEPGRVAMCTYAPSLLLIESCYHFLTPPPLCDRPALMGLTRRLHAGTIFVVDRELLSLGRAWCLYEVHVCLQQQQLSQLRVCLPGECIADLQSSSGSFSASWHGRSPPKLCLMRSTYRSGACAGLNFKKRTCLLPHAP